MAICPSCKYSNTATKVDGGIVCCHCGYIIKRDWEIKKEKADRLKDEFPN